MDAGEDRSIGALPDTKRTDSINAQRNPEGDFQSTLAAEKWWRSEVAARGGDVAGSGLLAAKVPPYAKTDLKEWTDQALTLWKQKDRDELQRWSEEKRQKWTETNSDLRKRYPDEQDLERWLAEKCKGSRDEALVIRVQPRVFLDIEVAGRAVGRLVIQLRYDKAPKTCENFHALCTAEHGFGYAGPTPTQHRCRRTLGSPFHRVIPGFMCQGGDFENGDGTGGKSIYGGKFEDENFSMKHAGRGYVSMANAGKHTNASQFFICLAKLAHLDEKHVVFGKVVTGSEVLDAIEAVGSKTGQTADSVSIASCGSLSFQDFV